MSSFSVQTHSMAHQHDMHLLFFCVGPRVIHSDQMLGYSSASTSSGSSSRLATATMTSLSFPRAAAADNGVSPSLSSACTKSADCTELQQAICRHCVKGRTLHLPTKQVQCRATAPLLGTLCAAKVTYPPN